MGGGGLGQGTERTGTWLGKIPTEWRNGLRAPSARGPAGGGSDDFSFTCYGVPTSGLGELGWDYGTLTWHTERDTYDKVVFDDLKHNATLAAMIAYPASEDPEFIKRDKSPGTWPASWPTNVGKVQRVARP